MKSPYGKWGFPRKIINFRSVPLHQKQRLRYLLLNMIVRNSDRTNRHSIIIIVDFITYLVAIITLKYVTILK